MASQRSVAALAARGAGNPEQMAAWLASRVRRGQAVEMASGPRPRVTSPGDIMISRSPRGGAAVRHRRGGMLIGEIEYQDGWRVRGGTPGDGHVHQRGALAELLSTWNRGATEGVPLQPPVEQTPLMAQYGVPAIRALATPVRSASDGARVTMANGSTDTDDDTDDDTSSGNGLGPRGKSIYAKLKAKGWPDDKAMKFAKQAEANAGKFGGGNGK
jgi:hypothetical protein